MLGYSEIERKVLCQEADFEKRKIRKTSLGSRNFTENFKIAFFLANMVYYFG